MTDAIDPLRHLRPLREEDVARITRINETAQSTPLAYDVYRAGGDLVIEFDTPGVAPEDIELAIEGRTIVVSLKRGLSRGPSIDLIESCRQHGVFTQRLLVGSRWDLDGLTAHAENGVLYVRAPLTAETVGRRVTVEGAQPDQATDQPVAAAPHKSIAADGGLGADPAVHTAA